MKLIEYSTVNGWRFELIVGDDGDYAFYQCRGEITYDGEHDKMQKPNLWDAAVKLGNILEKDGLEVDVSHSEKNWVEVNINNYKTL